MNPVRLDRTTRHPTTKSGMSRFCALKTFLIAQTTCGLPASNCLDLSPEGLFPKDAIPSLVARVEEDVAERTDPQLQMLLYLSIGQGTG